MVSLADYGLAPQSPGSSPGLGKPGWMDDPNNPNSKNNPEAQAKFQQALDAGYFGQPQWLTDINNEVSSAYGNNNQAYDGAYAQAMQDARSNITQQIGHALNEIGTRQGVANTGVQQLPGQFQGTFDRASAGVKSDVAAMNAQEAGIGGGTNGSGTFSPGNAAAQPGLAAIQASNAGAQAGVPVLQMAFDNAFSKQRQDVQTQGDQQLSDINVKEAEHNASLAESLSQSKASATHSLILQHYQDQAAQTKAAQAAAAKSAATAAKAFAEQPSGYSPKGGSVLVKNMPDVAASIKAGASGSGPMSRSSMAYRDAINALQGPYQQHNAKAFKAALATLKSHYPKQDTSVSLALNDLGITTAQWGQLQAAG